MPAKMQINLGIIGFGIMGERLGRAALTDPDKSVTIVGVWDPAAAAQKRLAAELPQVPCLASAEAVIAAADCVYIASPPITHLGHARAAMAAGKAVFSEKPLAVDLGDAARFVAEAEGARTAVNFVFASSLGVDQLQAWLAAGSIGRPERIDCEVGFADWPRPWQVDAAGWLERRAQGGFTREVLSHFLFLSRRLGGVLKLSQHQVSYPDGDGSETALSAELQAGELPLSIKGAIGETDLAEFNHWTLSGSAGAIRLRDWAIAEKLDDDGVWRAPADAIANEIARPLVLQRQLQKLARLTRGEPQDLAMVDEAYQVQGIVEALLEI
jgi:predicted dehydrogenase